MVAINEIPLPGCAVEGCGGDTDVCTDGRVHRNAENRAPTTRNRCRGVALGRWLTRDPIGYRSGINLYGYVNSSPVGSVDAGGECAKPCAKPPPRKQWSGDCVQNCLIAASYYVPATARENAVEICRSCCLIGHCSCVDAMVLGTKLGKAINRALK